MSHALGPFGSSAYGGNRLLPVRMFFPKIVRLGEVLQKLVPLQRVTVGQPPDFAFALRAKRKWAEIKFFDAIRPIHAATISREIPNPGILTR